MGQARIETNLFIYVSRSESLTLTVMLTLTLSPQANGLKLPISQEEMPPFIFEREGEQEAKE